MTPRTINAGFAPGGGSRLYRPTFVKATDACAARWPAVWLVYGDAAVRGWKDPQACSLYLGVPVQHGRAVDYREYRLRATTYGAALKRAGVHLRCPWRRTVTVYRFTPPPTKETVWYLETFNAKLQQQRRQTPGHRAGAVGTGSRRAG